MKTDMSKIYLFFIVFIIGCGNNPRVIKYRLIDFKDSIGYYNGVRFSGKAIIQDSLDNNIAEFFLDDGILYKQIYIDTVDSSQVEENIKYNLVHGQSICYWKDGRISYFNYKKGKLDGIQKTYSKTGKLLYLRTMKDGILNGPMLEYDYSGNLQVSGNFINNSKDSIWTFYKPNFPYPDYLFFFAGNKIDLTAKMMDFGFRDTTWIINEIFKGDTIIYSFTCQDRRIVKFEIVK
ncbi:MAG: hypothetical protein K9H64_20275 [Bacteroidales bacterium]|nr:hypothetical protein [Bacteroidales bacterium]MCF8458389.1 hypothetical protein [Bacteroidales bacterium]